MGPSPHLSSGTRVRPQPHQGTEPRSPGGASQGPPLPLPPRAGTYHDDQQGRGHEGPDGAAVEGQPAAAGEADHQPFLLYGQQVTSGARPPARSPAPALPPPVPPRRPPPLEMCREVATGVKPPRLRPECRPHLGCPPAPPTSGGSQLTAPRGGLESPPRAPGVTRVQKGHGDKTVPSAPSAHQLRLLDAPAPASARPCPRGSPAHLLVVP